MRRQIEAAQALIEAQKARPNGRALNAHNCVLTHILVPMVVGIGSNAIWTEIEPQAVTVSEEGLPTVTEIVELCNAGPQNLVTPD